MLTLELSGVVNIIVCRLCTPHSSAPWKLAAVVTILSVSITERLLFLLDRPLTQGFNIRGSQRGRYFIGLVNLLQTSLSSGILTLH